MLPEIGKGALQIHAFESWVDANDENAILLAVHHVEATVIDQVMKENDSFVEVGDVGDVETNGCLVLSDLVLLSVLDVRNGQ